MVNKKDLAKIIAKKNNTTHAEELENINAIFDTIEELLDEGKDVRIVGFGSFTGVERDERKVVNPKTSEIIEIGKRVTFKFVPGKHLRDMFKKKRSKK